MFLALRELRHSWIRYLLIASVMVLIAWLVFLLTGLANGLAHDNASAMLNLNADYVTYADDAEMAPHRSLLSLDILHEIEAINGVEAVAPLGHMTVTITQPGGGENVDMTILATPPDNILAPAIQNGRLYHVDTNEVVLDNHAKDAGIEIGDEIQVLLTNQTLIVVGFTENQTYSHLPVIFMDIPLWQSLKFPDNVAGQSYANFVSLIGVQMDKKTAEKVREKLDGKAIVLTQKEAVKTVPGFSEESGSINMIQGFLLIIAALIMTVFFYVLTMQKISEFGILKAIGADTGFLMKELLTQVVILSVGGILAGAGLTYLVASFMPNKVPFALDNQLVLIYGAILFGVALLGAQLSLWNISRVDPLLAIGRDN